MAWIIGICSGRKIAGYLSDITAAFDRVCKEYILSKLQAAGIGDTYLAFLNSYLDTRQAKVVVEGVASDPFGILNTVFQGTILGPPLWNLFFADVVVPAEENGEQAAAFADDEDGKEEGRLFPLTSNSVNVGHRPRAKATRIAAPGGASEEALSPADLRPPRKGVLKPV